MDLNTRSFQVVYRNYKGKVSIRRLILVAQGSGSPNASLTNSELYENTDPTYHPVGEIVFEALDIARGVRRVWAMTGILAWGYEAVARWVADHEAQYDPSTGTFNVK